MLVAWHIIHLHLQMVPVKSILFTNIMYTLIARCIMASAGVCWPPTPYRIWARFKTNVADLGRKQSRKSQFIRIQYHLQRHTYSKKFVLHSPFRVPFALNARHLTVYCIYYYNAVREKIVCALIICLPYMQQHNIANWAVLFWFWFSLAAFIFSSISFYLLIVFWFFFFFCLSSATKYESILLIELNYILRCKNWINRLPSEPQHEFHRPTH